MKTLALLAATLVPLAACASSGDDSYPITPGGDPATTGTSGTGSDTPVTLTGRICRADDLRDLTTCNTTAGNGGLVVTGGGAVAVTQPNGTFVLDGVPRDTSSLTIAGDGVVTTTVSAGAAGSEFPAPVIDAALYNRMLTANGIATTTGTGGVMATVARGGAPITNATMTSTPSPAFGPFYDGTTPEAWVLNGTGARGVMWAPGIMAGTASLTFADGAGGETTVGGVQVVNGGVTILDTVVLP